MEPEVLKLYSKHYQTGAPIPAELVAKIDKASKFNQGFATVEYWPPPSSTWTGMPSPRARQGCHRFEKASLDKIRMMPEIVVRYRSPYFQHIFASGYAAGYYS